MLVEHVSSDVGLAQVGVFYTTLSDFIYSKTFTYVGYYFGGDKQAIKQREIYGTTTSLQLRFTM